jgi:tetratricopeptide (TPR) repeat protein
VKFGEKVFFSKETHENKLQMITYLVNTLFKNGKYQESLIFAEELKTGMEEYAKQFYEKYLFYYYNALVINYSELDKVKAINFLNELLDNKKVMTKPYYEFFVYINLSLLCFDMGDYDRALGYLVKLYQKDGYKNMDKALKFKINIAEVIIRLELKEHDFIEHKIQQLRKDFADLISKEGYGREKEFIKLIKSMNRVADIKHDKLLQNKIRDFVELSIPSEQEDTEIIKYKNWLQTKLK